MNTSVICLMLVLAVAIAKRPCCMPNEYQGELYVGTRIKVQGKEYESEELLKLAVSYDNGKAVIKQNSPSGKVHVLVDYSGLTYVSLNGSCVSKEKTVATQTPRCVLCKESSYIRSAYFGAEENTLYFDTYLLNYKEYVTEMDQTLKNIKIVLSVAPIGDDEVVPIGEMGKFTTEGAKVNFGASFVNFKTKIEDEDIFDIPIACRKSPFDIFEDDLIMENRNSPKLVKNFNMRSITRSLPIESQQALAFISIA